MYMISAAVARIEYFFSGFVFSFLKDFITFADVFRIKGKTSAEVAQLVEHQLPKLRVAGSSPVFRSTKSLPFGGDFHVIKDIQDAACRGSRCRSHFTLLLTDVLWVFQRCRLGISSRNICYSARKVILLARRHTAARRKGVP